MINHSLLKSADLPSPLLAQLESRDAALWVFGETPDEEVARQIADVIRLPWSLVLSESTNPSILLHLEGPEPLDGLLVRRRGLIHLVDTDPAEAILPPRSLPVLLMNGRGNQPRTGLAALTRRLTMLAELRRRSLKQIVVLCIGPFEVPPELTDLWADGYRTIVTFVSEAAEAYESILLWQALTSAPIVGLVQLSPAAFRDQLTQQFLAAREGRPTIRLRNERGELRQHDISGIDDPEHPLIGKYQLIESDCLIPLQPSDLKSEEIEGFFSNPAESWRPFAAGMPWPRDQRGWETLKSRLRLLDRRGPEENRIFYVKSESGAGATTFLMDLAWNAASLGYPTLVAGKAPFATTGLEVSAFLTRLISTSASSEFEASRLYEVPALIVFDREHWEGREPELVSFAREIERSGRRACILIGAGPFVGIPLLAERRFIQLAELTHKIPADQALSLGHHFNKFLQPHGTARSDAEWRSFFDESATQSVHGVAAFWIVLSFWLQRQFNFGETVQSWIYRQFKNGVSDITLRSAILQIAAFSTVRTPYPDALLPEAGDWPTSDKLQDIQSAVGSLGLLRVRGEYDRFWAMIHDLLGRYLLTALFYDFPMRDALGYGAAANPEHLRFLVLRQISNLPELQQASLREIADAFAVSIFKIDPDHGHATFAPFWREALDALDQMPRSLRSTSRTFLHHGAISRRRIASDPEMFPMSAGERATLLTRAVEDIETALLITTDAGTEPDINLFNSLARAYHDLAEARTAAGASPLDVALLQEAAREATRRAYALNPDNSFVVETYAQTLLSEAKTEAAVAASHALEVLNLVYTLMDRAASEHRRFALSRLADQAFDILMDQKLVAQADQENPEARAIVTALHSLAQGVDRFQGMELSDYPQENRVVAAEALADAALLGNAQAVKLRYLLTAIDRPQEFALQLELLQSLHGAGALFTPQMQLEMAVLLYQRDRFHEGDQAFKRLRSVWRNGEFYVEVPGRLHWLLDHNGRDRRQVHARVSSNADGKNVAVVRGFQNETVLFRPQEFGQARLRPGAAISGYVSFGHNGPLLRPLTARQ